MSGTSPASRASKDSGPAFMKLIRVMRNALDYAKIAPLNVLVSWFSVRPRRHPRATECPAPPRGAAARGRSQPDPGARGDGTERPDDHRRVQGLHQGWLARRGR